MSKITRTVEEARPTARSRCCPLHNQARPTAHRRRSIKHVKSRNGAGPEIGSLDQREVVKAVSALIHITYADSGENHHFTSHCTLYRTLLLGSKSMRGCPSSHTRRCAGFGLLLPDRPRCDLPAGRAMHVQAALLRKHGRNHTTSETSPSRSGAECVA